MLPVKKNHISLSYGPAASRGLYSICALLLAAVMGFCIYYTAAGYDMLSQWYLWLNNCFYKSDEWAASFFTPEVHRRGRFFAIAGMVICLGAGYYLALQWKQAAKAPRQRLTVELDGWPWYVGIAVVAVIAGLWEWQMMPPAYDEIFSAVNCAEMHPFQALSYYMLPNNHILFNVLNSALFGWHGHLVGTGRLISLLAYTGVLLVVFHWLARLMSSRLVAFVAILPVAFQFLTWGMSAQARGYECQQLCGWLAWGALLRHQGQPGTGNARLMAFVNITGFALIPSWFYFYAAQLLFAGALQAAGKRLDIAYLKQQCFVAAGAYLFYLPAICFSGTAALAGNRYVRPSADRYSAFLANLFSLGRHFVSHCFSHIGGDEGLMVYVLFCLPLALLFTGHRKNKLIAMFYIAMWAAYILCSLFIRHTPFQRTLIVQFSITMAATAYTWYVLAAAAASRLRSVAAANALKLCLFAMPVAAYGGYLWHFNQQNVNFFLYGNDVNGIFSAHIHEIAQLPPGSSIAFSEESFYMFYHCRRLGHMASRCATGNEYYYVKRTDEQLSPQQALRYTLLARWSDDHELYGLKNEHTPHIAQ